MKFQLSVFLRLALVVLCLTLINAHSCLAQAGTQKWQFQNRGQVRSAVLGNLKDLRTSYEIITCAARQGMIRTVLQTYEEVIGSDIYNTSPEVCSSYALAHRYFTGFSSWDWKRDEDSSIEVLRGQSAGLQVQWFRDRALQIKPKSPEVLLSYALWSAYEAGGRPLALRQINEAVKLAPNWADAHFWRAGIILGAWSVITPTSKRLAAGSHYGTEMVRALNKAEKLDSAFHKIAMIKRYHGYQTLGDDKKALAAFDAYGRFYPEFAVIMDKTSGVGYYAKWRSGIAQRAQAQAP